MSCHERAKQRQRDSQRDFLLWNLNLQERPNLLRISSLSLRIGLFPTAVSGESLLLRLAYTQTHITMFGQKKNTRLVQFWQKLQPGIWF